MDKHDQIIFGETAFSDMCHHRGCGFTCVNRVKDQSFLASKELQRLISSQVWHAILLPHEVSVIRDVCRAKA